MQESYEFARVIVAVHVGRLVVFQTHFTNANLNILANVKINRGLSFTPALQGRAVGLTFKSSFFLARESCFRLTAPQILGKLHIVGYRKRASLHSLWKPQGIVHSKCKRNNREHRPGHRIAIFPVNLHQAPTFRMKLMKTLSAV